MVCFIFTGFRHWYWGYYVCVCGSHRCHQLNLGIFVWEWTTKG